MYIIKSEVYKSLANAIYELADGDLLLHTIDDKLYFEINRIYCDYAGYVMSWRNFIGFQNVMFYARIKYLKVLADFNVEDLVSISESYEEEHGSRAELFGYIVLEDSLCELINSIISQAKVIEEKLKPFTSIIEMKEKEKAEVYKLLIPLYCSMFMFKALRIGRINLGKKEKVKLLELKVENIEAAWHLSEVHNMKE